MTSLPATFVELIRVPFSETELVWGIVPLYVAWLLNELSGARASFQTALQTGFSLVWSAAHWLWQYQHFAGVSGAHELVRKVSAVNLAVTLGVLLFGLLALVAGIRRRYPKYCAFLGHTRFSHYFMIAIFPIQSGVLPWTWDRVAAIAMFSIPVWLALHLGTLAMSGSKKKKKK